LLSDAQLERLIEQPHGALKAFEQARDALKQLTSTRAEVYGVEAQESQQLARCEARLERALTGALEALSLKHHLPRVIALIGGTNTGKSATLNLLAGREVSQEKMSANATKRPLIYAHERWRDVLMSAERPWATPEFASRSDEPLQRGGEGPLLSLHSDERLMDVVLIDSPDLDSTASENTYSAAEVMRWAERVLFVVTPHKYKDALLVDALGELLARAHPVSVLFNMVSAPEHLSEMQRDLQNCLASLGVSHHALNGQRGALSFTPMTPKLSLAERREGQEERREALLKALEPEDRALERRERLKARLGEVSAELTQLSVLLSEGSEAARALERSLSELITREAQQRAEGFTPPLDRSQLRAQLQQLSLSTLLSNRSSQRAAHPHRAEPSSAPSRESTALSAAFALLITAAKSALSQLHHLLISDALVRCTPSPYNGASPEARRVEELLNLRQVLLEYIEAQGSSHKSSQNNSPTFSADALTPSPQGAQALHAQRRLEAEVREALGAGEAMISSPHDLVRETLLKALERTPITELEREARVLVSTSHERPQAEEVTLWSSARAEAWLIKGALALSFTLLTFGLGPWDLLWAPLGFELGVYPLAWRAASHAKRNQAQGERHAEARRYQSQAHALYLTPLQPLLCVQARAQLASLENYSVLKDLLGTLDRAAREEEVM
jgi:hypothetical protein